MSGEYDFAIPRGADWNVVLTWQADGNPVDLTGWHACMQIRPGYNDQTDVVFATLSDQHVPPEITLGGTAGTITLVLTNSQTTALSFDPAPYDLKLTDTTGRVTRLLQGVVTLSDEVTGA